MNRGNEELGDSKKNHKKYQPHSNSVSNSVEMDRKNKDSENLDEIQTQIHHMYSELADFYKQIPFTIDRSKYVDNVITDIESIVSNLEKITDIDDCKNLPQTSISTESIDKHAKNLQNINLQWWDRLRAETQQLLIPMK